MVSILSNKLGELSALCGRYSVKRLAVFGSALRSDFDEESSDLDFVVEFSALEPHQHKDAYFGLLEALGQLFSQDVDLIELHAVKNPYVKKRILEEQETLYDAA
ncbi:MAG: nucleotidyltransferase domain-containing protein [Thermoanaerobaculales bacterium]|jgi:predicted nucleotidyltransferase|nr:nucleotidyltransferase domain-containing protein [Thermoanaerobaculales bacterium]